MLERIYGRIRYLGRKRKFRECERSDRGIRKGISARYGRRGVARMRRNDVQVGRIARKIYGKETI